MCLSKADLEVALVRVSARWFAGLYMDNLNFLELNLIAHKMEIHRSVFHAIVKNKICT